jgi:hypothetical protein
MNRPPVEVADIVRASSARFIEKSGRWLHWSYVKVLRAVARCRTAALGGHRDQCPQCGHQAISYNSCRNRHCPKCQTAVRDRWVAKRQAEVLPVGYFHVVFTLPHELSPLALQNKKELYRLLLQASADTLLEVAANPQHLGAAIGFLSILHTWGQNLLHHPHVHCVVPGGGISPDQTQWIHASPKFLVPVPVLKIVFRAKVRDGLDSSAPGNSSSPAPSRNSPTGTGSSPSWSRCARKSGSSTPKRRSAAPIICCSTSPAIPIEWPSPITGSSPSMARESPFVGRTTRMATRSAR